MNITLPIAISDTEIWVFVERDCPCGHCIDAARIACMAYTSTGFVALPTDDFYTDEHIPASRRTEQCFFGLRWATIHDITSHPHIFQHKDNT